MPEEIIRHFAILEVCVKLNLTGMLDRAGA